jgi:hypothetical protein
MDHGLTRVFKLRQKSVSLFYEGGDKEKLSPQLVGHPQCYK